MTLVLRETVKLSIKDLLEQQNCFTLEDLKEVGLGIFLYYATKSLNVPEPLPEVYDKGSIILDGYRLTDDSAKASLSGYYFRPERYRCFFMALETTTLCIIETPFFRNTSMPLAIYPEGMHFDKLFHGLQTSKNDCNLCQIGNALRFNICRYSDQLSPETLSNCLFEGTSNFENCEQCLIMYRKKLEQIEEELLPSIVGWPCVRLNVHPDVIRFLFPDENPDEEPFREKSDEVLQSTDIDLSFNLTQRRSNEELWNSFIADYLAVLFDIKGKANQSIKILSLDEGYEENFEIDCILLHGETPCLIIETCSGGSLEKYHNLHMLRKFRVFSIVQTVKPEVKCVYIYFGRRKPPNVYKTNVAAFRVAGHVYIQLEEQYRELEQIYQKRKPFGASQLRILYHSVLEEICKPLGRYLGKDVGGNETIT